MTELNTRDRELAAVVRETLERKAHQHDPLLDAALAATRAKIAAKKPQPSRWLWFGGLALAASLAVVVVLPYGTSLSSPENTEAVASVSPMPDADLQFLESMDMLVAMQ